MTAKTPSRHTLVIGGTSGTGKAYVASLAANGGQKISVIGRKPVGDLPNVHSVLLDLRDNEKIEPALKEIIAKNGRLTHLIFFQRYRGQGDEWQGELQVGLTATRAIIEYCVPHFDGTPSNSIVAVSSLAASQIADEQPVGYHVAKAGLNQMVKFYAFVLGRKSIRVNAVTPGTVIKEENREFFEANPDLLSFYKQIVPLGRLGTSQDIIQAVNFLTSDAASFVTGQNIVVDGGLSLVLQESLARSVSPFKHPNTQKQGKA